MRPSNEIVATLKKYGGKMCKYAFYLQYNHNYTDSELAEELSVDLNEVNAMVYAGEWVDSFAVKQDVHNKISVKEQEPAGSSIFCEVTLSDCSYGNMYFVCNLDRKIIQHRSWLAEYRKQLKTLGYEFR